MQMAFLPALWLFVCLSGGLVVPQPAPPGPLFLPLIFGPPPPRVLIAAAYIDSTVSYEPDEAILLWNTGGQSQPLAGWVLEADTRSASFPLDTPLRLEPGQRIWCTANTASFRLSFGEEAGCSWSASDNSALQLSGSLTLRNSGGALRLRDGSAVVVDTLLYGDAALQERGWLGPPASLYTRDLASSAGQIWQRKLDPFSGLPVDTDRASDWASDLSDSQWGRRIRQPGWGGWSAADGLWPQQGQEDSHWTAAVGPEGLYVPLASFLASATHTLDLSLYTFEHPALATLLADKARSGLRLRLLLDGAPPGGITDTQKWCVQQIAEAGGDVRYLAVKDSAPAGYKRRYRYLHAKYAIADGRQVFVGTDNLTLNAAPLPTGAPVGGRRGFFLFTDAPSAVAALQQMFAADWRPELFADLFPYTAAHPRYGAPPSDFQLPPPPLFVVADAPFTLPLSFSGQLALQLLSAPENALRPDSGFLALLAQAGPGDEILLMQMAEQKFFGPTTSNPIADPNPRLEAVLAAARRGARVRLLLDSFFDDPASPRNNQATIDYVSGVAAAEGLDLAARIGNPTAGGIHAKLLLLHVGGQWWSAVGSLNGSEGSYKLNREAVLLVESAGLYGWLGAVFAHDWERGH